MMTKQEMEALRNTINNTDGYECRHQKRKTGFALIVKHITQEGAVSIFPVRKRAEWDYLQAHPTDQLRLPTPESEAGL
jgi:hypothetical protein